MDFSQYDMDPDAPLDQAPPAYLARRLKEVAVDYLWTSKACHALIGTIRQASELLEAGRADEAQDVLDTMLRGMGMNHARH